MPVTLFLSQAEYIHHSLLLFLSALSTYTNYFIYTSSLYSRKAYTMNK